MKYTLLKKWHESQVEEVGHVFEEKSSESYITYKVKRDDGYVNYYLDIQPHEIALLVHAGYLGKEREHQASFLTIIDVIEDGIYRELHLIRQKAGKNQLKLIAEITHAIRKVFNSQKSNIKE